MQIELSEKAATALRLLKTTDEAETNVEAFLAAHANQLKTLPMRGREGLCSVLASEITLPPLRQSASASH
jgi:hypothetical protein